MSPRNAVPHRCGGCLGSNQRVFRELVFPGAANARVLLVLGQRCSDVYGLLPKPYIEMRLKPHKLGGYSRVLG